MSKDQKKSPWLKDQAHPADLPEEVYEGMIEKDDATLVRDAVAARLMSTPVPPENEWKTCWTCAKKVPLVVRDSVLGVMVCRQCAWTSFLQEFLSNTEGIVAGIADFLGGAAGFAPEEDDEEVDDDPDAAPEVGGGGADDLTDAMPISPSAVEADGGGESKAEPQGEAAPDAGEKPEEDAEPEKKD